MAPPEVISVKPCPLVPAFVERPILFSAPMVRALLDGSKTQTRRMCKRQPYAKGFKFDEHDILCHNDYLPPSAMLMDVKRGPHHYTTSDAEGWEVECPYGLVGDRLWVRETWQFHGGMLDGGTGRASDGGFLYTDMVVSYPADGTRVTLHPDGQDWPTPKQPPQRQDEVYSLRDAPDDFRYDGENTYCDRLTRWWNRKIPAIHMYRWASRITLEITGVRVERLQDISEADALAEGIDMESDHASLCLNIAATASHPNDLPRGSAAVAVYKTLWEQINGADSWAANPWVWVVEFRRIRP